MAKPAYKKDGSEYSGASNEKIMKSAPATSEAFRNSHGGKPAAKMHHPRTKTRMFTDKH